MRSLSQFLHDYGDSHQNTVNQWVHIACVPAILISTLGLFWLIPVGSWLGLSGSGAYWVNGATILAGLSAIQSVLASGLSLFWTSLVVWIVAWAVQVVGHKIEGKKPSFVEDLVFLLIGPIFVSIEFAAKLGIPVPYAQGGHDGGRQPQSH